MHCYGQLILRVLQGPKTQKQKHANLHSTKSFIHSVAMEKHGNSQNSFYLHNVQNILTTAVMPEPSNSRFFLHPAPHLPAIPSTLPHPCMPDVDKLVI